MEGFAVHQLICEFALLWLPRATHPTAMADVVEAPDGSVADLISSQSLEEVADLIAITGQSLEEAARLLEAAGSVEAAVSLFFDGEAAAEHQPAIEVTDAPPSPEEADSTASSSAEISAAPRGKATAAAWQPAATGDTFRRRLLVGPDAVRQLHEDEHRAHHLVEWKSQPGAGGQWQVELAILNQTAEPLEVLWIDWQAEPQSYGTVAPGATFRQTTRAEHAWLVRSGVSGDTSAICLYAPKRSDQASHSLRVVAAAPPAVEEAVPAAAGAGAGLVRFARLLCSTEGAMLVGLVAALFFWR